MKRIISIMLCLACLCALLALPVAAAPTDPMAVKFQKFLDRCDSLYDGDVMEIVLADATKAFVSQENQGPVEKSAAEFETELEKQIVLSDAVLNDLRSPERGLYNSATDTYTLQVPEDKEADPVKRQYRGYVKTGENTYDVYYQEFEREDLNASTEVISQYKNPITNNVEYNGKVYVRDANGYYCVRSWGEGGNKYSIEVLDGKMRFISGESFGADQLPETFDDVVVTYNLPKDNAVYLDDVACFPDETLVKVEKVTGVVQEIIQAMAKVSTKYVAYEFTATQNGSPVQPNAKLKTHFAIPEDFGANTVVMYLDAEGQLTELTSMVKNIEGTSFLVTELEHFSTYLLVDKDAKPVEQATPTTAPTTEPTTAPTTAPTQAATAATQATAAATNATTAPTQATNGATKVTAPATKPTSVTVVRPTVPATSATVADPTEVAPTEETAVAPTEEVAPTGETSAAPTEAPKPAKSNKTGSIVAAVIIVIVLAGGGFAVWWFYFRKKKEQVETEEVEETEEKTEE